MKRIGDWLDVLGVNTLDEHLSYVTHPRRPQARPSAVVLLPRAVVGGLPRDRPQYFARLSAAMSPGRAGQPTSWCSSRRPPPGCTTPPARPRPSSRSSATRFQDLLRRARAGAGRIRHRLRGHHRPARLGRRARRLRVGQRAYDTVVLPPLTENLNGPDRSTLLEAFVEARRHGALLRRRRPSRVDGQTSDRGAGAGAGAGLEAGRGRRRFRGLLLARDAGQRFCHRARRRATRASCSTTGASWTTARSAAAGQHEHRGAARRARSSRRRRRRRAVGPRDRQAPSRIRSSRTVDGGRGCASSLPPCGSLLLFLSRKPMTPAAPDRPTGDGDRAGPARPAIRRAGARTC